MFTVNDQVITRFNYFDVHRIVANFVVPSHSSAALFIKRLSLSLVTMSRTTPALIREGKNHGTVCKKSNALSNTADDAARDEMACSRYT